MKTDLDAERMAADAALAAVEQVRFPLAAVAGWATAAQVGHWFVGLAVGAAVFFLYGRAVWKRHDAAWKMEDTEFIDTEY